jgi:hypothetical protein
MLVSKKKLLAVGVYPEVGLRDLREAEWPLSLADTEIGARPIKDITAPDILRVLCAVAARGRFA